MLPKWLADLGKPSGMTLSQYNPGKRGALGVAPAVAHLYPWCWVILNTQGIADSHWERSQGMLTGVM